MTKSTYFYSTPKLATNVHVGNRHTCLKPSYVYDGYWLMRKSQADSTVWLDLDASFYTLPF